MKAMKHEKELLKKALEVGQAYAVKRGYERFDQGVSADQKFESIYRLLVNDKLLVPLPADKENGVNIKHRLVKWIASKLPEDHPLLK